MEGFRGELVNTVSIASIETTGWCCRIKRGSPHEFNAIIGREIRQLWGGKKRTYRIIFVVEGGTIAILHVRHSRQAPLGTEPSE